MSVRNKVFLSCILFCFFTYLFLDFSNHPNLLLSNILKYLSIWLIFFLGFPSKNSLPLFLTLLCDYLLLFTNYYLQGVALFCLVHLFYLRLFLPCLESVPSPCFIFLLFLVLLRLPLEALCCLYALAFLLHIVVALSSYKKCPFLPNKLYFYGLLLFLLCDVCVALSHLTNHAFLFSMIWLFYGPSQLFLAISFLVQKSENKFLRLH